MPVGGSMAKSIRIVPAILANDAATLEKLVRVTETFTDFAQVDIMDGKFVPSHSVSYRDIAALQPRFNWEAHLMVQHPEDYLEGFKQAGAQKIIFHFEAKTEPEKTISLIKKLGMQAGLAVNPKTNIADFAPLVKKVGSVLFLSVEPGFYGAEFIPAVLDKIVNFRKAYPKMEIGIDGGVKEDNIKKIIRTGVDVICVGSAIFNRPDPISTYFRMRKMVGAA
jgi:ribulose-phosphate 3-epimerase